MNEGERGVGEAIDELRNKIAELSDFVEIYSVIAGDSIIFTLDSKGNFSSVKKGDVPVPSLKGKPFLSFVSREDRKNAADIFMKCLSGEKVRSSVKVEGRDGESEYSIMAIPRKRGGKIDGIQGIAREVESGSDYERLLDLVSIPVCVSDLLGNITASNPECSALLGYREIEGRNIFDFIDEDYAPEVRKQSRDAMDGIYIRNEAYVVTAEGVKVPVEIDVREIKEEEKLIFSIREMTGKKAMEREAEDAEEKSAGHFRRFRDKLSAIMEIGGKTSADEIYMESVNIITKFFDVESCIIGTLSGGGISVVAAEGGAGETFEKDEMLSVVESGKEIFEVAAGDKRRIYFLLSFGKKVLGVMGVEGNMDDDDILLLDILSGEVAKSVLYMESELSLERYMETMNQAVDGIYRTTFDGRILEANPAFLKIFGYDDREEELKGMNAERLFLKPQDRQKFLEMLEKDGTVQHFESRYVTREGKTIFGRESAWVVPRGGGRVIEGIFQDITRQKRIEEDARFYNSLLRHDIYNKNEIAIGYLGLLKSSELSEKDREAIKKAITAIMEGNKLIETVKKLETIGDSNEMANINMDEVMGHIIEHYSEEARKRDIDIIFIPTGAVVRGNDLIEDVFSNLIKNAMEHSYGQHITVYAKENADGWNIYVEDDGKGLPDGAREKIFQQGWRGRGSRGSGLGLYLVKKIVEGFEGRIRVQSNENDFPEGCRFIVWLKKGKTGENRKRSKVIGHESEATNVRL